MNKSGATSLLPSFPTPAPTFVGHTHVCAHFSFTFNSEPYLLHCNNSFFLPLGGNTPEANQLSGGRARGKGPQKSSLSMDLSKESWDLSYLECDLGNGTRALDEHAPWPPRSSTHLEGCGCRAYGWRGLGKAWSQAGPETQHRTLVLCTYLMNKLIQHRL